MTSWGGSPALFWRVLLALGIGATGGAIFATLGTPLPWMLGALFGCLLASILSLPVASSNRVRTPMSAVIGVMMGASFSPELLAHVLDWWLPLTILLVFLLVSGGLCFLYFRYLAGFDTPTAFFSGVPGGLIEMVVLGGEAGADMRRVVLVHSVRIVVTVFSIPFIVQLLNGEVIDRAAGAGTSIANIDPADLGWFVLTLAAGMLLSRYLRLPARQLLGPMAVSALVHGTGWLDFQIPFEILAVAQVVIGSSVGCRFAGTRWGEMVDVLLAAVVSSILLIVLASLFAWGGAWLSGHALAELLLSYSPGGLAEMGILAIALQLEVAMISTHHAIRVLLVVMGASALSRKLPKV